MNPMANRTTQPVNWLGMGARPLMPAGQPPAPVSQMPGQGMPGMGMPGMPPAPISQMPNSPYPGQPMDAPQGGLLQPQGFGQPSMTGSQNAPQWMQQYRQGLIRPQGVHAVMNRFGGQRGIPGGI